MMVVSLALMVILCQNARLECSADPSQLVFQNLQFAYNNIYKAFHHKLVLKADKSQIVFSRAKISQLLTSTFNRGLYTKA